MVGAVVFYDFIGRISHVGIVERVHPDGSFDAIEGNTNGAGSREGGQAMRKRRTMAKVVGFGYPDYSSKEGDWLDMATKKEVSDLIDNRLREYFGKIIGSGQDSFEHTIEAILRVTQRTFNEANAANAKADGIERISTRLEAQNKLLQRGQTIVVDEASAKAHRPGRGQGAQAAASSPRLNDRSRRVCPCSGCGNHLVLAAPSNKTRRRAVGVDPPVRSFAERRVCAASDCQVRLSAYNPTRHCSVHHGRDLEPKASPAAPPVAAPGRLW